MCIHRSVRKKRSFLAGCCCCRGEMRVCFLYEGRNKDRARMDPTKHTQHTRNFWLSLSIDKGGCCAADASIQCIFVLFCFLFYRSSPGTTRIRILYTYTLSVLYTTHTHQHQHKPFAWEFLNSKDTGECPLSIVVVS